MSGWQAVPSDKTAGTSVRRSTATTPSPPRPTTRLPWLPRQPAGGDPAGRRHVRPTARCRRTRLPDDRRRLGGQGGDPEAGRRPRRCTRPPRRRTSTSSTATSGCRRRTSRCRRHLAAAGRQQGPGDGGPVSQQPGIWYDCAGANHTVTRHRPGLPRRGRQPLRGPGPAALRRQAHLTRGNQTVAPNFNLFTDVPLPDALLGPDDQRPGHLARQDPGRLRRGRAAAERAHGHLRLVRPARRHRHDRPQRHVRGHRALDVLVQLPAARRSLPWHVLLQGQRPRPAGPAEQGLQPAVPDHRHRLPGLARTLHGDGHRTHADRRDRDHPGRRHRQPGACDVNAGVTDAAQTTPDLYTGQQAVREERAERPDDTTGATQTRRLVCRSTTGAGTNRDASS